MRVLESIDWYLSSSGTHLEKKKDLISFLITCMLQGVECACVYRTPWSPEGGARYPGASISGGCELSDMSTGNWTQVLCKSTNKCSQTLSHLSSLPPLVLFFEAGSHYVAQATLKTMILLP